MADSTSDQADQPRKKFKHSPTSAAIGQTTHIVEQDGYGKHMHPTISTIPEHQLVNHFRTSNNYHLANNYVVCKLQGLHSWHAHETGLTYARKF
jgi:hypothetical protein